MKRFICILLAFLMISPSALLFTKAAGSTEYPFSVSSLINLSDTGKTPGANSSHGNHQTRTVHTTHGDYAAYITDSYAEKSTGKTIDKWSLFKIDTESGTSEIIFTGEKYYDSSQVSLLVDKDENVISDTVFKAQYCLICKKPSWLGGIGDNSVHTYHDHLPESAFFFSRFLLFLFRDDIL